MSKRWDEQWFPYEELKPLQAKYNIQTGIDGEAHFACDYRIGFALGFGTCEAVRTEPPKTFRQACQWTAFFNCASRIYTHDGAGFQMDTLLWPFYEKDQKAGILDDEPARFLIANLLLIDPHYYQISGVDKKTARERIADSFGALCTRIEEEKVLTWEEMYQALDDNFADPPILFRFHPNSVSWW